MEKDFDFSNAKSIVEFWEDRDLPKNKRAWRVKEDCQAEDGNTFAALLLQDGGHTANNRPTVVCFSLSKKLTEKGVVLTKQWVKDNRADIMLIEPQHVNTSDGHKAKFGVIYVDNGDDWEVWK